MRRHHFVANTVARHMPVAGVWQEVKTFQPLSYAGSPEESATIERHFEARDASEARYFAGHDGLDVPSVRVPAGGCNDPSEINRMRALAPDVVLVFGTGLLRRALIETFAGQIINIHLGLSPYYRGAGTNFWPLVNGEPEYCGATVHFLDAGVDTGPIIAHVRPEVQSGDGPHDIGNKIIAAAADMLVTAALAHVRAPLTGVPQSGGGRVYRRADFTASAVERMNDNFASGMIDAYLQDKAARDAPVGLVDLVGARS
jgi:hypothetical protein